MYIVMYIKKVTSGYYHWFIILLFLNTKQEQRVMVKLKFIIRDRSLVLRISEGKKRYYKSVKHLLIGSPNLTKHWNADKERFSANAVSYSENNKILEEFKGPYTRLLLEHPELTARQVASYFQPIKQVTCEIIEKPTENTAQL